jgi:hypothetical protein
MRRAVTALVVSGLLLTATGCSLSHNTASGQPVPGGAAAAPVNPSVSASLADTRSVCDAIGKVYSKDYAALATALSKLVSSRKGSPASAQSSSKQQAQEALRAFADDVRGATQTSTNDQVRTDGTQTADQLKAHADDGTLFDKVKSTGDMQNLLGPTMKGWLAPISNHCT